MTRAVLPIMRQQRAGHVINLSSIVGYQAAAGVGVYSATKFELASVINHHQPGDPVRLAAAVVKLVDAPAVPLRLPLGTDTLKAIGAKNAYVTTETEAWKTLAESTDYPTPSNP